MRTPRAIAVGPDGKIYVANFINVTSYLPDGTQTKVTMSHIPDQPNSLAVDATGKIYVGYYGRGGVGVYSPDGVLLNFIATPRGVSAITLH